MIRIENVWWFVDVDVCKVCDAEENGDLLK